MEWPSLPDEMVAELIRYSKGATIIGGEAASFLGANNESVYAILEAPSYLLEWVKVNISDIDDSYVIGLQRFLGVTGIPIHVDSIRSYAYNNVLTNDPAVTCFYDKDNNLIDRVKYGKNKWYYHNTTIPHNIINLATKFRLAITMFKVDKTKLGEDYALSKEALAFINSLS